MWSRAHTARVLPCASTFGSHCSIPGEVFAADGRDAVRDEKGAQVVGHMSVGHGIQALVRHRARRGSRDLKTPAVEAGVTRPPPRHIPGPAQ